MSLFLVLAAAIFVGFFTPFLLIYLNHDTRCRHIRLIKAISENFEKNGGRKKLGDTPTFGMVLSKYLADFDLKNSSEKMNEILAENLFSIPFNRHLLLISTPYMLIVFSGFFVFLLPFTAGPTGIAANLAEIGRNSGFTYIMPNDTEGAALLTLLSVMGFGFLGSYVFSLNSLLRAVSLFDLDGRTFLHALRQILTTVISAGVAWRLAASVPVGIMSSDLYLWCVLAFMLGFVPDGFVRYIFTATSKIPRLSSIAQFMKTNDDSF